MALDATIVEVPKPPAGRLPFLLLLARVVSNPVASWGRDFYQEPIVVYDEFGLQTVFVMDPELIQAVLLDDIDSFSKSPIYKHVLGEGGGEGVLIAEGERWRWQRRLLAPLFRAEEVTAYVPAFVSACAPPLATLGKLGSGLASADPYRCRRCHSAGSRGHGARRRSPGGGSPARRCGGNGLSAADRVEGGLRLAEIARLDAASRPFAHGESEPRLARGRRPRARRTKGQGRRRQRLGKSAGGGAGSGHRRSDAGQPDHR